MKADATDDDDWDWEEEESSTSGTKTEDKCSLSEDNRGHAWNSHWARAILDGP